MFLLAEILDQYLKISIKQRYSSLQTQKYTPKLQLNFYCDLPQSEANRGYRSPVCTSQFVIYMYSYLRMNAHICLRSYTTLLLFINT